LQKKHQLRLVFFFVTSPAVFLKNQARGKVFLEFQGTSPEVSGVVLEIPKN
jgi:hypothetical protein